MADNRNLREALERQIAHRLGVKVRAKKASMLHAHIPVYRHHWSAIGRTFYVPSTEAYDADPWYSFKMLAQGYVLLEEQKKDRLFWPKWLFPQGFAALALLAVFSPWWLLTLIFLAPWPAPWRRDYLVRAYGMGVAIGVWTHGQNTTPSVLSARVHRIHNAYYLWPCFNKLDAVRRLHKFNSAAITGSVCRESEAFHDVLFLLVRTGKYTPHHDSHQYNTYQRDRVVLEAR
jgi:hypothetical protein